MIRKAHLSIFAVCLLTLGLTATAARADVTYTFSAINDSLGDDSQAIGFQFTSATFITSATSLLQSQLTSCTNCQISSSPDVIFAPNVAGLGDLLQFNDSNNVSSFFEFSPGTFAAPGTYFSGGIFNPTGTLIVTAVPEPTSTAMTLAGWIMLAMFALFQRGLVRLPHKS